MKGKLSFFTILLQTILSMGLLVFATSCDQTAYTDKRLNGIWWGDMNLPPTLDFSACPNTSTAVTDLDAQAKCIQDNVVSKYYFPVDFLGPVKYLENDQVVDEGTQIANSGGYSVRDILTREYPKKTLAAPMYKTSYYGYRIKMRFEDDGLTIEKFQYAVYIDLTDPANPIICYLDDRDLGASRVNYGVPFEDIPERDLGNDIFLTFTTMKNNTQIFTSKFVTTGQDYASATSLTFNYEIINGNQLKFKEGTTSLLNSEDYKDGEIIRHRIDFESDKFIFKKTGSV